MGEWKRWLPPALAAVGMLLGVFLLDWAVIDHGGVTEHVSPLGSEACVGGACADLPEWRATWNFLRKLVLACGLVGGLGCLLVAVLRFLGTDPAFFGKAASGLSAATVMFSIVGLIAIAPDSMGDYGAGGLVTIVAAGVGITARGMGSGDSVFGSAGTARARLPLARATALPAEPPAPSKVARPNPVGAVAADALRGALRFIVVDGSLTATGLVVRFERKVERTITWSDITEVAARRLPPDPPYEKTTFVDLVTAQGPLRLVPSSRLDYAALPGGMAPNTRENWRRLVALAREHNPGIVVEAESADFFAGGRDAPMFTAFKKFQEWDRRYS